MWIGTRNEKGELTPMAELDDETVTCLSIEAGSQGMALGPWILKVLQVSLDREDTTATEPPARDGYGQPCLELNLSEALMQKLMRYCWTYEEYASPGDVAGCLLCFAAHPSHIEIAIRLRGMRPEDVAATLIDVASAGGGGLGPGGESGEHRPPGVREGSEGRQIRQGAPNRRGLNDGGRTSRESPADEK